MIMSNAISFMSYCVMTPYWSVSAIVECAVIKNMTLNAF